ncbi:MAG: 3-dehydroquinate synthase [Vicingaceae bacterium]
MRATFNLDLSEILYDSKGETYKRLAEFLDSYDGWMLILDEHTNRHCLPVFIKKFGDKPKRSHILHSGDQNKTLDRCSSIWTKLTEIKANRNFALVNLGGGLVTDIAGFAAACYMRGIDYVNIPTSLLGMIDAAHGGKTGINYKGLKNQIGAFHMPSMVLMDVDYLSLLSESEMKSGYAEIMKHALIADPELWEKLKIYKNILEIKEWRAIVKRSVQIKFDIVKEDPLELGERKLLNFGHTIGHAFESYSHELDSIGLSHGEAVAAGMIVESAISADLGLLAQGTFEEIARAILDIYPKFKYDESDFSSLFTYISHDKKNTEGILNFTLLKSIGQGIYDQEVEAEVIRKGLKKYMELR